MNKARKTILVIGAVVMLAMCACPPWKSSGRVTRPFGYAAIWKPPQLSASHAVRVDTGRLAIQLAALAVVTGVAVAIADDKKQKKKGG